MRQKLFNNMKIQEIKAATSKSSPYFFSKDTLRFFGQTLESFKVYEQKDGRFLIEAPMLDRSTGKNIGTTKRFFNPKNFKIPYFEFVHTSTSANSTAKVISYPKAI